MRPWQAALDFLIVRGATPAARVGAGILVLLEDTVRTTRVDVVEEVDVARAASVSRVEGLRVGPALEEHLPGHLVDVPPPGSQPALLLLM